MLTFAELLKMARRADLCKNQTLDLDTTKLKFYTGPGQRVNVVSVYWDGKKNTIILDLESNK